MAEKVEYIMFRVTTEQKKTLESKARDAGFKRKSDFMRSVLFNPNTTNEMIKEIYTKVVKNG
jgi:hypothetical protein